MEAVTCRRVVFAVMSAPFTGAGSKTLSQCNGLSFLSRAYGRHLSRFPANTEQEAASRKAASCSRAQNQNDKATPAPYVASLPDLPTLALKVRLSVARRLAPIAGAFSPSSHPYQHRWQTACCNPLSVCRLSPLRPQYPDMLSFSRRPTGFPLRTNGCPHLLSPPGSLPCCARFR